MIQFLYLQISIQPVEGCKFSPGQGGLNVTRSRTEPMHEGVEKLGLAPG